MNTILIVDDDSGIRELVRRRLEGRHRVITAADGPSALAAVRAEMPDLVLLDLCMPGMGGVQVLRDARLFSPGLHAILMTGSDDLTAFSHAFDEGAQGWLLKPFSCEELDDIVEGHLLIARA